MAIEPITGFYVHDEETDTDGVAKVSIEAVHEFVEDVSGAVDSWLDEHPEATTTVQDDSLTTPKYKDGSVTSEKLNFLSVIAHETVSNMIADETLRVGDMVKTSGYNYSDDGFGGVYRIVSTGFENEDYENLSNGLYAIKDLQITHEPTTAATDPALFVKIAETYQAHATEFLYASDGVNKYATAFDSGFVSGTKYIDCSTLSKLLINQIPYENSKYNGEQNKTLGECFLLPDDYTTTRFIGTRYTHEMALFFANKGLAYYPNEELTNIRPGDICFFNFGNTSNPIYFKKIDHCAIFLGLVGKNSSGGNMYLLLSNDNDSQSRELHTVFYVADETYLSKCVLCASIPTRANAKEKVNILVDSFKSKTAQSQSYSSMYATKAKIKPFTAYTCKLEVSDATAPLALHMPSNFLYMNGKDFLYLRDSNTTKYIHIITGALSGLTDAQLSQIQVYNNGNSAITIYSCELVEGWYNDIMSETLTPFRVTLESGFSGDFLIYPDYVYISVDFSTNKSGSFRLGTYDNSLPIMARWIPAIVRDEPNHDYYMVTIHIANGEVSLISTVQNIGRVRLN